MLSLRIRGVLIGSNEYEMGRNFVAELQASSSNTDKLRIMTDLQNAVARVRTPAELLLRSVSPVADQDDPSFLEFIKKSGTP